MNKLINRPMAWTLLCAVFATAGVALFAQQPAPTEAQTVTLDLGKVFKGSPIIYSILLLLSMTGFVIWLYSLLTLKTSDLMPQNFVDELEEHLHHKRYEAAQALCKEESTLAAAIARSGLEARNGGAKAIQDAMEAEGKRRGLGLWQRISVLNDIAMLAPMLGLLGTVIGMFYAFYDVNRSTESLAYIFDGLGIAIGTTVSGLIVAIVAVFFHTTLKFRLVRALATVENRMTTICSRISSHNS